MMLVDPKILSSLKYDQPPTSTVLSDLDAEMQKVLDQKSLSDEEKVEMYNQILQKHISFYRQHRAPHIAPPTSPTPSLPEPTPDTTLPTPKQERALDDIIQYIPATFQR